MNIRKALLALALLVISPFAFADEMGTGCEAESDATTRQNITTLSLKPGQSGGDTEPADIWQMLIDWFE